MDLLKKHFASLSPNFTKAQVNVSFDRVELFKKSCEQLSIDYEIVEELPFQIRFEIEASTASAFHLGTHFGIEIAN